jgi:murein DD-endopeptidase MepM/ murein hydrolase activator NlpD
MIEITREDKIRHAAPPPAAGGHALAYASIFAFIMGIGSGSFAPSTLNTAVLIEKLKIPAAAWISLNDPAASQAWSGKDISSPAPAGDPALPKSTGAPTPAAPALNWYTHVVRRGETLDRFLSLFQVETDTIARLLKEKSADWLLRLIPGRELQVAMDQSGQLRELRYETRPEERATVSIEGAEIRTGKEMLPVERRMHLASATVTGTLFAAAKKARLDDKLVTALTDIFAWEIDFARDVRPGDRFTVAYEELFRTGKPTGTRELVAAEFVNQGRVHRAVRFTDDRGRTHFYTPQGTSLRGAFLRTPVKFSRITSGFSRARLHPVLGTWRAHKGVDYAAQSGTPVLATADGVVSSIGRDGGYGKAIQLRHGASYTTLYAHLSRFAQDLRVGSAVRQGQVIGAVGSTGLASGPHLHYEFRVNNTHRDPLSYPLPRSQPIATSQRGRFLAEASLWIDRLNRHGQTQIASAAEGNSGI